MALLSSVPKPFILFLLAVVAFSCMNHDTGGESEGNPPFVWDNANVYFLLTDRFMNGDPSNDLQFGRTDSTGVLRGFLGGDLAGVTGKIESGYFDALGITAIWLTPWYEQIHGSTDEGTGVTYGYHGYWPKDWTRLDPNFGTEEDLATLVETAHRHGIRIVMDVVINHTGPVTPQDPVWPADWVRTSPVCKYENYESTVTCTLVKNLPDIRTESDEAVDLPAALLEKWDREGRLEKEMAELDEFFSRTGYPRAPRYYIIKWLTDFVRKYGIDGYRLDTAKHVEEGVWKDLFTEASKAFSEWKASHPDRVLDDVPFWMVGEVYGYSIGSGRRFDYGDRKVDFYAESIHSLINFSFKEDVKKSSEELFSSYSELLSTVLDGCGVLNYLTSHDDPTPFDRERKNPIEAGTRLLLAPGACQIYYGDESSRNLDPEGAVGDATLRGPMNWDEIARNEVRNGFPADSVLQHFAKLGIFRKEHLSVGAGLHRMISGDPYVFAREYNENGISDRVIVGLDLPAGQKAIPAGNVFGNGTVLFDYYSGTGTRVKDGTILLDTPWTIVLLGQK